MSKFLDKWRKRFSTQSLPVAFTNIYANKDDEDAILVKSRVDGTPIKKAWFASNVATIQGYNPTEFCTDDGWRIWTRKKETTAIYMEGLSK